MTRGNISDEEAESIVGEGWEKVFDYKISNYTTDDGFIVYVENYDNSDFDTELIKSFISSEKEKSYQEGYDAATTAMKEILTKD